MLSESLSRYKHIWIIGASSGIGLALAQALDHKDRNLYLSARDENKLNAFCASSVSRSTPLGLDVTDGYSLGSAAQAIRERQGYLDMVIVNAGTCEYQEPGDIDCDMTRRVTETNYLGAVSAIAHALPLLRAGRSEGPVKLVVMSSSVTYQPLPRAHAYGASKAALRYYTECLRIDLMKEDIDVHLVSPGFVKTPLTDRNDFSMPCLIEAEDAAERIIQGLVQGDLDIHFPKRFTRSLKLFSTFPERLKLRCLARMTRDISSNNSHRQVKAKECEER